MGMACISLVPCQQCGFPVREIECFNKRIAFQLRFDDCFEYPIRRRKRLAEETGTANHKGRFASTRVIESSCKVRRHKYAWREVVGPAPGNHNIRAPGYQAAVIFPGSTPHNDRAVARCFLKKGHIVREAPGQAARPADTVVRRPRVNQV